MHEVLDLINLIWKLNGLAEANFTVDTFKRDFCSDLPLPLFQDCEVKKQPLAVSRPFSRVVSQNEIEKMPAEYQETLQGVLQPVANILLDAQSRIVFSGGNTYDSAQVEGSDNIYRSTNIYYSRAIHDSRKVAFCTNSVGLENCAACDNTGYSQFVIRAIDSINCSRCIEVYQSGKCSNSMFLSNCYDVHESILCTNLRSKRYCIGNRQYSNSDFKQIKDELINELIIKEFKPMYTHYS